MKTRIAFLVLFALLTASRLCHIGVLWEGDVLPLAAASQILEGKTLYRDIWYDKPPLVPAFHLLSLARPGWGLRLADACYALLGCLAAFGFARDLWSRREGLWAAGLLGFYLIFYLPSAVIPVGSDFLLLAPHLAAIWMAYRRRPFWSGVLAGIGFWISPKAMFVAAACLLWHPMGAPLMAAGFAAVSGVAGLWLWTSGAAAAYWEQVWAWGRLYAGDTFVAAPVKNGVIRNLNWAAFQAAAVAGAVWFLRTGRAKPDAWKWVGWAGLALAGTAAGMRFFPRYYFLLLPVVVLMAARVLADSRRARLFLPLLLLVPLLRFAPSHIKALSDPQWGDTRMDSDSREAAWHIRRIASPRDTLFVWGYRPELYVYSGLPAATMYLDSQPLTGVPADRHLTQSDPVDRLKPSQRRESLTASRPTVIVDGLGLYNPRLSIQAYPELRSWFSHYREVARTHESVIYRMERNYDR